MIGKRIGSARLAVAFIAAAALVSLYFFAIGPSSAAPVVAPAPAPVIHSFTPTEPIELGPGGNLGGGNYSP